MRTCWRCEVARIVADLSETTVLSPGEEERLALGPGTPLGNICLYSSKKTHVCINLCIRSFSLWHYPGGKPRVQPSSSLTILLATQQPAQFVQSTGPVVHFYLYFVSTQFPHFNPVFVKAQKTPLGGGSYAVWSSHCALWSRFESNGRGKTQLL